MSVELSIALVQGCERADFEAMALDYFRELDPRFEPRPEWKERFFASLFSGRKSSADWLLVGEERAGFVILGLEPHRYQSRHVGSVQDFYVAPAHRRSGLGTKFAQLALDLLKDAGAQRIQLEIMSGNSQAEAFWSRLGFAPFAARWVQQG